MHIRPDPLLKLAYTRGGQNETVWVVKHVLNPNASLPPSKRRMPHRLLQAWPFVPACRCILLLYQPHSDLKQNVRTRPLDFPLTSWEPATSAERKTIRHELFLSLGSTRCPVPKADAVGEQHQGEGPATPRRRAAWAAAFGLCGATGRRERGRNGRGGIGAKRTSEGVGLDSRSQRSNRED